MDKKQIVLTAEMALRPFDSIKQIWAALKVGTLKYGEKMYALIGSCVTVRAGKAGKMLFLELLDGSTVRTLQCICDSMPDDENDARRKIDWLPLFSHCSRGATVELVGRIVASPAKGQEIEMEVIGFKCLGAILNPDKYFLGQRGFLSRDILRKVPHLRGQTQLYTAIQIVKQRTYRGFHDAMKLLNIGETQPTLITGNQCESGSHPFTVSTLFDGQTTKDVPVKDDGTISWDKDFFQKRVYLSVSGQLHLEACVVSTKRDSYCVTTACRGEPSVTSMHLAEFCMPEVEVIGGGLIRNMSIVQFTLKHIFSSILEECIDELLYLEAYRKQDDKKWYDDQVASIKERKKDIKLKKITKDEYDDMVTALNIEHARRQGIPSIIDRLVKFRDTPFAITTHKECIGMMLDDVAAGKVKFDVLPRYDGDINRQHEHYITQMFGEVPTFVKHFPKEIKAFYMPVIKEDDMIDGVEHVDGYDLLMPYFSGEVVGGSQRIDNADELVSRMTALGMDLKELDWYIDLRRNASVPHGGFGIGVSRLIMAISGIQNVRDLQEFVRACGIECFA